MVLENSCDTLGKAKHNARSIHDLSEEPRHREGSVALEAEQRMGWVENTSIKVDNRMMSALEEG